MSSYSHLTHAAGAGCVPTLSPTSKRTFGQPSSCALSRSFRALVFLLTLRFLLQYLHSLVLREFGLLLTRSTDSSPLSSV